MRTRKSSLVSSCSDAVGAPILAAILFFFILFNSCQDSEEAVSTGSASPQLFSEIPSEYSGIHFQNELIETEASNYYKYMYSYIGAGMAAADFNNDGLDDLFFISNQSDNILYLNKGELKFEDITSTAGIKNRSGFDAGVSIADINNDGYLDIYITRGGWIPDNGAFKNMLYINKGVDSEGVPSFIERAEEHGLADDNRAIQASFFDYDRDGDLDVYISNTPDFEDPAAEILDLADVQKDPATRDMKGSDKFYQNDGNGYFKDISEEAGILPDIGFGLNPQVGDLNNDGWLDVYVCNDFRIPDFAYLNNKDGTFREGRNELLKHMSFNSMGSDIADINNDGLPDLYTLDMNPEDYIRSKTTMGMTPQSRFEEMVTKNYHYQYMHNMLQINNGNGTFREISKLAGVADTDWSWSALLADYDLDGFNDVFVTNGVFRDVIDRDANARIVELLRSRGRKPTDAEFLEYTNMLPQQKLTNYFFKNNGDWTFQNMSSVWTDSIPSFSNGAVYSDLDNDGDLEIIVNNINQEATILKNNAVEQKKGHYLLIELIGPEKNMDGIGTKINLNMEDSTILTRRKIRSRGFLSSVSGLIHFGLRPSSSISFLEVIWPDGKKEVISNISPNQKLTLNYLNASIDTASRPINSLLFDRLPINYTHVDPSHNDYDQQILLPHKLSQTGPGIAIADLNQDGFDDVFLGGGHSQAGQLLLSNNTGGFNLKKIEAFEKDKQFEDVSASFFDADQDGDEDLYVASGSYEFYTNPRLLIDRLYLNDGAANFTRASDLIPEVPNASSAVAPADLDGDGDLDLFVGGRVIPGQYPFAPRSYMLINEDGRFVDGTEVVAPTLAQIGMVTDAVWSDLDADLDMDLIITGEWLGIEVFLNEDGKLVKSEKYETLSNATGWWNKIVVADTDQDGDKDIIAGNLGLNYKFHATPEKPFHIYTNDFDYNGTVDVFLAKYYKGEQVPVRGKTCSSQQLPHLNSKIPTYMEFATQNLASIIGPGIENALHYEAVEFRSGIFVNEGDVFTFAPFENLVQQSPINSILYQDIDGDDISDLLMIGNNYMSEIETTRADAGIGYFLQGKQYGFKTISHLQSGFLSQKDSRHLAILNSATGKMILVANNNHEHDWFRIMAQEL